MATKEKCTPKWKRDIDEMAKRALNEAGKPEKVDLHTKLNRLFYSINQFVHESRASEKIDIQLINSTLWNGSSRSFVGRHWENGSGYAIDIAGPGREVAWIAIHKPSMVLVGITSSVDSRTISMQYMIVKGFGEKDIYEINSARRTWKRIEYDSRFSKVVDYLHDMVTLSGVPIRK